MFGYKSKKPRVLIVDDDPGILGTLRDRLEFNDLEVITAVDGRDGLAAAIAHKPNIIITDIAMPLMDGIEMVKAFRNTEIGKHLPIIVITGNWKTEDVLAANELHIDECLQKPFEMSTLLGKIKNLLEVSTDNTLPC